MACVTKAKSLLHVVTKIIRTQIDNKKTVYDSHVSNFSHGPEYAQN